MNSNITHKNSDIIHILDCSKALSMQKKIQQDYMISKEKKSKIQLIVQEDECLEEGESLLYFFEPSTMKKKRHHRNNKNHGNTTTNPIKK